MPSKPPTPCSKPGCHRTSRRLLCTEHARAYEAGRRVEGGRYTDRAWRKLRKAYLEANPWCVEQSCVGRATDVDHLLPRAQGGSDEWENLQPLCHSCHSRKTSIHDGGFGNTTTSTTRPAWSVPDVTS